MTRRVVAMQLISFFYIDLNSNNNSLWICDLGVQEFEIQAKVSVVNMEIAIWSTLWVQVVTGKTRARSQCYQEPTHRVFH